MKVKTNLALIIDNQRIEAGSTINIDDATYPSIAAYVTVLEPTTPSTQGVNEPPQAESVDEVAESQTAEAVAGMAEVTEDKPKRKRA